MRALLVQNPIAGGGITRSRITQLQQAAGLAGYTLDIVTPDSPAATEQAARHGVAEGYRRILVAGGDGTINRMAAVLHGTDIPLGIIPVGTVNVLARELNIPFDPLQALQVALHGRIRRVDLGMANGQIFTLMAGLGFDAQVVAEVVPRLKELFGPLAYVTAGLHVLTRYRPSVFHLQMDGIDLHLPAWLVVVGNASYYAYQLALAPDARMDDGLLDVCLFAERSALDRMTQIGATFLGQHVKHPNVRYFRVHALQVSADPPVSLQLDGDAAGASPVDISVLPSTLGVMIPSSMR